MALVYKPTKLDQRVLDKLSKDVKAKKYVSENNAINSILKKHYGVNDISGKNKK